MYDVSRSLKIQRGRSRKGRVAGVGDLFNMQYVIVNFFLNLSLKEAEKNKLKPNSIATLSIYQIL